MFVEAINMQDFGPVVEWPSLFSKFICYAFKAAVTTVDKVGRTIEALLIFFPSVFPHKLSHYWSRGHMKNPSTNVLKLYWGEFLDLGVTTDNLKTLIFSEDLLDFISRTHNHFFNTLFVKVV